MSDPKSETKDVSSSLDTFLGTSTYQTTITDADGDKTSALGNSAAESEHKASEKHNS